MADVAGAGTGGKADGAAGNGAGAGDSELCEDGGLEDASGGYG